MITHRSRDGKSVLSVIANQGFAASSVKPVKILGMLVEEQSLAESDIMFAITFLSS